MEEPKRKSFLDVLKHNLSLADRYALTTRLVYIGSFKGAADNLKNKIESNVKSLNEEYDEVVIVGILLLYPNYFLHLIEATEEIIYKHLQSTFYENLDTNIKIDFVLNKIILLPGFHNVYKMYYSNWYAVYVTSPPFLLDAIENNDLSEIQTQIKKCLFKMYSLSEYLMDIEQESTEKMTEALKNVGRDVPHLLPEITVVDYLINVKSSVVKDLHEYMIAFNNIPSVHLYNDRIWPPICSFVPRTLH